MSIYLQWLPYALIGIGLLTGLACTAVASAMNRRSNSEQRVQSLARTATAGFDLAGYAFAWGIAMALFFFLLKNEESSEDSTMFLAAVFAMIYVGAVHAVAKSAETKGRTYFSFFIFACFFLLIAAVVVMIMGTDSADVGDFVELTKDIELDEGDHILKGHRSKVHESDLSKRGDPLVLIDIDDDTAWVLRSAVRRI